MLLTIYQRKGLRNVIGYDFETQVLTCLGLCMFSITNSRLTFYFRVTLGSLDQQALKEKLVLMVLLGNLDPLDLLDPLGPLDLLDPQV